ncbi:hypothetical protein [uncultured Gardnerella sp.]|uniref:hypothetical protein n=1 Tax=uncultured Gardnerella sp. TaxID=293424 RepID=UPI002626073C|nr:hypothetical protein [uncultured Gardnerella sp.]
MLNKKAIAAFAAGATLLAGMAFAAPVVATAPAFANEPKEYTEADFQKELTEAQGKVATAEATRKADYTDTVAVALKEDGTAKDGYEVKEAEKKVVKKADNTEVAGGYKYVEAVAAKKAAEENLQKVQLKYFTTKEYKEEQEKKAKEAKKKAFADAEKKLGEKRTALNKAWDKYAPFKKTVEEAKKAKKAADRALEDYQDNASEDFQKTTAYAKRLKELQKAQRVAEAQLNKANAKSTAVEAAFTKALEEYNSFVDGEYKTAYEGLGDDADVLKDPKFLKLDADDFKLGLASSQVTPSGHKSDHKNDHKNDHKQNKQNSKDKGKHGVHINTKGRKGKKQLGKTGVGVAFAALAAALLAGMGAAVRKIRH